VFQMAKLRLRGLGAFVPDMRGWLRRGGWEVSGESKTYYGGITYPPLHALPSQGGFTHIPSIGVLRVAVSPNKYPLEMNLARDNFAAGEGTGALFRAVANVMDTFLADDLGEELAQHESASSRSAIAGFHSWTLLHLWTGQVPSLSSVPHSRLPAGAAPASATPWPRLTKAMEESLLLRTIDRSGTVRRETLASLIDSGAVVVAAGTANGGISESLAAAVFAFAANAQLMFGLPDASFGIIQMRHWASEEFLIPVPEHGRCAFGLRLARSARPFAFFPRETEFAGIPVASGPRQYALLDYRDLMAEVSMQPNGGPSIVSVLNRRNEKVAKLLAAMCRFPNGNALRRELGGLFKECLASLVIGNANRYTGRAFSLLATLNVVAHKLNVEDPFLPGDIPAYMKDGNVTPFGRAMFDELTARTYQEIDKYDVGFGDLA
jgi:hypothetical protein